MMSNHHLRNKKLSLKAVGLMSKILSLPDEWDYSLKGLAKLNTDGIDGVRSAVQELEDAGYIIRRQRRDKNGRMAQSEYLVFEIPELAKPASDSPSSEKPMPVKPATDVPTSGNPMQINTNQVITHQENTLLINTPSINHSGSGRRNDRTDWMDSKKPDEARERIVRLMGDLPRVELFARQSPEGWDVWGNEVECTAHLPMEETPCCG